MVKCAADENSKKTGCVKCNNDYSYFNVKSLECVACKQFDQNSKICYDNMTYVTNTSNTSQMLGVFPGDVDNYVKSEQSKYKNNPDGFLICPSTKPYALKGVCQSC